MPPMRKALLIIGICLALFAAGCGDDSSTKATDTGADSTAKEKSSEATKQTDSSAATAEAEKRTKPKIKVPQGPPPEKLEIKDLEPGSGPAAKPGDEVTLQYVGVDYKTGKQFDASWDRGEPFTFELGSNVVIPGWEKGIVGMKVDGRRELIIPPAMAYGNQQVGTIAPNSTLVFVVDLLEAK
jgi:peptidylprolyl isomerase